MQSTKDRRSGACGRAGVIVGLAGLLLAACATQSSPPPPTVETFGRLNPDGARVTSPQLYVPGERPVALSNWRNATPAEEPIRAVVYVGQCNTWESIDDHLSFLLSQGHAVVLPAYNGQTCVIPEYPTRSVQRQIGVAIATLQDIPWVDQEHIYLMGHGVGSDSAVTYPDEGAFDGIVGLAAACPYGQQEHTPLMTFRANDDLVLANRNSTCSEVDSSNTLHVDFDGGDHYMLLARPGNNEGRRYIRAAVASFLNQGKEAPASAVADGETEPDALAGGDPETGAEGEAAIASPQTDQPASEAAVEADATAPTSAETAALEPEQATQPQAQTPQPAPQQQPARQVAPSSDEIIQMPTLALPPGRF